MMTSSDNIISDGYLREYEQTTAIEIPDIVQRIIAMFFKQYSVFGIGSNICKLDSSKYIHLTPWKEAVSDIDCLLINGCGKQFVNAIRSELYVAPIDNNNYTLKRIQSTQTYTHKNNTNMTPTSSIITDSAHSFVYATNTKQLYKSNNKTTFTLKRIDNTFYDSTDSIIDIQSGLQHTLFLTRLGFVYSVGSNDSGQCGLDKNIYKQLTPKLVPIINGKKYTAIACGELHSLFINENQQLLVCGYNYVGQLGITSNNTNDGYETSTTDTETIWGSDDSDSDDSDFDDERNGTVLTVYKPMINEFFDDLQIKISKIKCGKFHSLIISSNGECFTFGSNAFGNLGNGCVSEWSEPNTIPQKVEYLNEKFIDASCGENHNLLVTKKSNKILCFGDNRDKQCSMINEGIINSPLVVSKQKELGISKNCFVEKVVCSENKSLIFIDYYKRY